MIMIININQIRVDLSDDDDRPRCLRTKTNADTLTHLPTDSDTTLIFNAMRKAILRHFCVYVYLRTNTLSVSTRGPVWPRFNQGTPQIRRIWLEPIVLNRKRLCRRNVFLFACFVSGTIKRTHDSLRSLCNCL